MQKETRPVSNSDLDVPNIQQNNQSHIQKTYWIDILEHMFSSITQQEITW